MTISTFVLILVVFTSSGVTTHSHEYFNEQTCEAAGDAASKRFTQWGSVSNYVCAKK